MERYVCIHGHFYQPPRENPWLESIEREDSAYPYHDWNERITAECYGPNALARVLDEKDDIIRIVNNYASISFNFGPTLLAWMETKAPDVHRAIVEADEASRARFSGHGSAIAQAYNHVILPLASSRDKRTQVIWGVRDFEHRFRRKPEGMWLPECAVDLESLDLLAEAGIKFTILAPRQAHRVRRIGAAEWSDATGGRIDPSMPYRVALPSGRSIVVFFYDGPISQGIAFEGLLHRGEHLAHRLLGAFSGTRTHPQIVHVATDGETYGHHHRRGEMALAYALAYIEANKLARITNYGEHLERMPPTHEATIFESSSWSCVHGVERWRSDCGCNTGSRAGWNQAWRGPLRAALDWLRDELEPKFEERGARIFRDPWAARDAYVSVVLDRAPESIDAFFAEQALAPLPPSERTAALKLMEMARHAMLMYTSCGWFFDEVSGLEPSQVLQYAGRALQLAEEVFDQDLELAFLQRLELAKSNVPEMRDARHIYEAVVRPARVDLDKVAAHYALTSLFHEYPDEMRVHAYDVRREDDRALESGPTKVVVGRVRVSSSITFEEKTLAYGVLFVEDHNLHGGVRAFPGDEAYQELLRDLEAPFATGDLPGIIRALDRHFGSLSYSLHALFRDEQRRIVSQMLEPTVAEAEAVYRQAYDRHAPLMRFVAGLRVPLPRVFHVTTEFALNGQLRSLLDEDELDATRIKALLAEARAAGVALDHATLEFTLRGTLVALAAELARIPDDVRVLQRLEAGVEVARAMPFSVSLWEAQNAFYRVRETRYPEEKLRAERGDDRARLWLQAFVTLGQKLRVKVVLAASERAVAAPAEQGGAEQRRSEEE